MNNQSPAQPSLQPAGATGRTAPFRLRGTVLLGLGFAFSAAALVGAPEKATVAPATLAAPIPSRYAAVRNWVWETRAPAVARASEHDDFDELWLAR